MSQSPSIVKIALVPLVVLFATTACERPPPATNHKVPMPRNLQASEESLVRTVASSIVEPWERVVINFEMADQEDGGGVEHDMLGFYIVRGSAGKLGKRELRLTQDIQDAFTKLNAASLEVNEQYWSTCDLVLDSSGKFKFNYSFDPPKRINGILDHDSYYRFSKYLEQYEASQK